MSDDLEIPVATLVPVDPTLIHAAPTDQVLAVQTAYHSLCEALLDDSDYQNIGGKQFRKKSGWRKLAVAFNVSTELLSEHEIRGSRNRIEEVKCIVRATAPNGRYQDGLGVCSIYEKCCDTTTCTRWEFYPDSGKPTGHVHCGDTCNGRHHFSNPAHDIPSTAMTRAANRALADLFGMGEVSAEEIVGGGNWSSGETADPVAPRSRQSHRAPSTPTEPKQIAPAQASRIEQLCAELEPQRPMEDVIVEIVSEHVTLETMTFAQARRIIDTLEARKAEHD